MSMPLPITDQRFRAFSFVDRITFVERGRALAGTYTVPVRFAAFPLSLAAEAVGQLAAWAAMEAMCFRSRPVAGLAGRMDLLAEARPGETLALRAEIESLSEDEVVYHGEASQGGTPILRLRDCVGPMVPMAEFDEPAEVQARYALLGAAGAPPGSLGSVPELRPERLDGEPGEWVRAMLRVPASAPFFADHFPRQPVFPGTLLMHAHLVVAARLVAEVAAPGSAKMWQARRVSAVKLRTFTPPGDALELTARVVRREPECVHIGLETRKGTRVVATSQAHFAAEAVA